MHSLPRPGRHLLAIQLMAAAAGFDNKGKTSSGASLSKWVNLAKQLRNIESSASDKEIEFSGVVSVALQQLNEAGQSIFLDLGIFAPDVWVPVAVLKMLWRSNKHYKVEMFDEWVARSLLEQRLEATGRPRAVRLHRHVLRVLAEVLIPESNISLRQRHRNLLKAVQLQCCGDDHKLSQYTPMMDHNDYLSQWLMYHLVAAERVDTEGLDFMSDMDRIYTNTVKFWASFQTDTLGVNSDVASQHCMCQGFWHMNLPVQPLPRIARWGSGTVCLFALDALLPVLPADRESEKETRALDWLWGQVEAEALRAWTGAQVVVVSTVTEFVDLVFTNPSEWLHVIAPGHQLCDHVHRHVLETNQASAPDQSALQSLTWLLTQTECLKQVTFSGVGTSWMAAAAVAAGVDTVVCYPTSKASPAARALFALSTAVYQYKGMDMGEAVEQLATLSAKYAVERCHLPMAVQTSAVVPRLKRNKNFSVPSGTIGRHAPLSELRRLLLTADTRSVVLYPGTNNTTIAGETAEEDSLLAEQGMGKRTLALQVANDVAVLQWFEDGVAWVDVSLQHNTEVDAWWALCEACGFSWPQNDSDESASTNLLDAVKDFALEILSTRHLLIIFSGPMPLDLVDVLKKAIPEPNTVMFVVDRVPVSPENSAQHHCYTCPPLSDAEALALVNAEVRKAQTEVVAVSTESDTEVLLRIVRTFCRHNALCIAVVAAAVGLHGQEKTGAAMPMWSNVEKILIRNRDEIQAHGNLSPHIACTHACFTFALKQLGTERLNSFLDVAALPRNEMVPLTVLKMLWKDPGGKLIKELLLRRLLLAGSGQQRSARVHPMIQKFFELTQAKDDLVASHKTLVRAFRTACYHRAWHKAKNDGYVFQWLHHHLVCAGLEKEARLLRQDFSWHDAWVKAVGRVHWLVPDLARDTPRGDEDELLVWVAAALQASMLPLLQNNQKTLPLVYLRHWSVDPQVVDETAELRAAEGSEGGNPIAALVRESAIAAQNWELVRVDTNGTEVLRTEAVDALRWVLPAGKRRLKFVRSTEEDRTVFVHPSNDEDSDGDNMEQDNEVEKTQDVNVSANETGGVDREDTERDGSEVEAKAASADEDEKEAVDEGTKQVDAEASKDSSAQEKEVKMENNNPDVNVSANEAGSEGGEDDHQDGSKTETKAASAAEDEKGTVDEGTKEVDAVASKDSSAQSEADINKEPASKPIETKTKENVTIKDKTQTVEIQSQTIHSTSAVVTTETAETHERNDLDTAAQAVEVVAQVIASAERMCSARQIADDVVWKANTIGDAQIVIMEAIEEAEKRTKTEE